MAGVISCHFLISEMPCVKAYHIVNAHQTQAKDNGSCQIALGRVESAGVVAAAMTWPASGSRLGFCQLSRLSLPGAPTAPRAPEALAFTSSSESSFFEGRRWPPSRAFGDLGGDEPPLPAPVYHPPPGR